MSFNFAKISDIISEDSPSLYVVNNSARSNRTQAGIIFITVSSAHEGEKPVYIPKTWVPFDLTSQMEKDQLLRSSDFRKCVSSQIIKLVLAAEAEQYFANDAEAAVEFDRANQDLLSNNNFAVDEEPKPLQSELIAKRKNKVRAEANKKLLSMEAAELDIEDALPSNVNQKVMEILLTDSYSEAEKYSYLRNCHMNENFTPEDCEYILSNCDDEKIKAFVINLMNKRG